MLYRKTQSSTTTPYIGGRRKFTSILKDIPRGQGWNAYPIWSAFCDAEHTDEPWSEQSKG